MGCCESGGDTFGKVLVDMVVVYGKTKETVVVLMESNGDGNFMVGFEV